MGDGRADEKASFPPRMTKTYVHRWPRWWDDIERPDVPFPKYSSLRGDVPSAQRSCAMQSRLLAGAVVTGLAGHAQTLT